MKICMIYTRDQKCQRTFDEGKLSDIVHGPRMPGPDTANYSRNLTMPELRRGFVTVKQIATVCASFPAIMQIEILRASVCARTFTQQLTTIHLQSAMRQSCDNQTSILAHYFISVCAYAIGQTCIPAAHYCCRTRE